MENEPDLDPEHLVDRDDLTADDSGTGQEALYKTLSGTSSSMVGSYRTPSFVLAGSRPTVVASVQGTYRAPNEREIDEGRREERSLLRDNHLIPPKHSHRSESSENVVQQTSKHLPVPSIGVPANHQKSQPRDGGNVAEPISGEGEVFRENTPLLGHSTLPYGGHDSPSDLDRAWGEAVLEGKIHTTWQREAKVLWRSSGPLVLTFLLQYSLIVASIFTVGHLGKVELGAVSLASMTANITGYSIYQGLATSLDTLCSQAYGSGKRQLVGLQTQRMVYFLWTITIPVAVIWLCADLILMRIVPEKEVAALAGTYLKIVLLGAPGYATFESVKRYLQAQGIFSASLYVLLICSPLNALMNWLFVWVGDHHFCPVIS